MSTNKKIPSYFDSHDAQEIISLLQHIAGSHLYNTGPSYSADAVRYPDNLIPFVDKHMNYLRVHPKLDPHQYLANIRLMTRVKS